MASKDHKIIRRASALNELSRLSGLLAEHLDIEVPNVQITNKDAELAEIQRIESINALLAMVLDASDVDAGPFSGLTKAQLLDRAAAMKIDVNKSATKSEIIEALEHGPDK